MAEIATRRRLAAILAADVVGYSRLMETAESRTLARLKALRAELIDPLLLAHGGRLIKLMGDGALVEFPSVVQAVECAIAIQEGLAGREAGCAPSERLQLRIGINLGDIMVDGDDLYGDGVNIAARIEPLAEPGGIMLSAAAFDQVTGKLSHSFRDFGEHTLKNIARPVRLYALTTAEPARSRGRRRRRTRPALALAALLVVVGAGSIAWSLRERLGSGPAPPFAERPVVAVLPFRTLGDEADAYFGDGLTEDIAGGLSKFGELAVIDPAAARRLRDRDADLAGVGQELGARYLVRGTLRRDGQQLRVTAQLLELPGGALRWSQSYDVTAADLFGVQDDITRRIAGAMAVRLDQLETARVATKAPESFDSYETVLKARQLISEGSRAGNREARRLLADAVAREPSYAPAQAALGKALLEQAISGWTEFPADAIAEAERAAQAALTADPGNAPAMAVLANVHLTRKQFDLALAEVDRALQLNPSDAEAYSVRGDILTWAGDHAGAIEAVQAAQKLNPALGYGQLGWCYYLEGRYREAIAMLTHAVASDHSPLSRDSNTALLAASYAQLGETEAAAEARSRLARYSPFFDPEFFVSQFGSAADRERLREGLGKAGIGPANQHKTE